MKIFAKASRPTRAIISFVLIALGAASVSAQNCQVGAAIELQPQSRIEAVCNKISGQPLFYVEADGLGTLEYQWRLDGKPLTNDASFNGVTTPRLFLNDAMLYKYDGNYDVIVWDSCGREHAVTSSVATLTITPGPEWTFRTTNGPPPRFQHTMAYDSARRVSVMFGGYFQSATNFGTYNDLWEWNGVRWTVRSRHKSGQGWVRDPVTGHWRPTYVNHPVDRADHAMAYDPRRGRTVIFGGAAVDPGGSLHDLKDLWEWDGAQWFFRGTNGPEWRRSAALTYNSNHETVVLVGGLAMAPSHAVWEWDGAAWKTEGITHPETVLHSASAAYDSFRDLIFFGPTPAFNGIIYDVFWTLKDRTWTAMGGAFNNSETAAAYGRMVYDSYRRRSIYTFSLKGAAGYWDSEKWKVIAAGPQTRFWHALAYDSARHAVPMFGGTFGSPGSYYVNTNDTWEITAVDLPLINEPPASQYRKLTETAVFSVAAVAPSNQTLRYQWFRDNTPLESKGNITGATTATLTVASVLPVDAGKYSVQVSCDCGATTSLPAILTLKPDLQIFAAETLITLIWSDPQAVLEQAEDPAGPWTAVAGATSPFSPGAIGKAKFFRLRPTTN